MLGLSLRHLSAGPPRDLPGGSPWSQLVTGGLERSSVAECLQSMHDTLSLIPSTAPQNNNWSQKYKNSIMVFEFLEH
jgi:hypothetical protein